MRSNLRAHILRLVYVADPRAKKPTLFQSNDDGVGALVLTLIKNLDQERELYKIEISESGIGKPYAPRSAEI